MMVISTTLLGRMQTKFLLKFFPSNFSKQTMFPKKVSTTNHSTPKSPTKTSNIKCFKCLGFGHIALHCPQKLILKINKVKQDLTNPPTTSKKEKDKEGQVDMGLILSPPRCFPSLLILPVDLAQKRCLVTVFLTSLTPRALQVRTTDSLSENLKNTRWRLCGRWRSDAQVSDKNTQKTERKYAL